MNSVQSFQLDYNGYIPLYVQLANVLRAHIEMGEWTAGHIISTETQLMNQYQVSRTTVREAVSLLVNEGLLKRKQGKGTLVCKPKVFETLGQLTGFSQEIRARGMTASALCLQANFVKANKYIASTLGVLEDTSVFRTYRLRLAEDEPIAIEESYWPQHIGRLLLQHDLNTAAYYDILELEHHIILSYAEEQISAVVASTHEARHLQIAVGAPLLQMDRITTSTSHGIIEYCQTKYRADRYNYRIRLQRLNGQSR